MKKLLFLSLFIPHSAMAWKHISNSSITEIAMWIGAEQTRPLYFKTSADFWCYIPAEEARLQAFVIDAYRKKSTRLEIHCYDEAEQPIGPSMPAAHKIHRIIAK